VKKDIYHQSNEITKEITREFHSEFKRKLPNVDFQFSDSELVELRIPAVNKEFGGIEIHIWCREITVCIGENFHTHFEINISHDNLGNNNAKEVISEVIEFVGDILNDKILLRIKMQRNKVISSSIVYENDMGKVIENNGLIRNILKKETKIIFYSWSGRLKETE
jgi:hypothetical protein